MLLQYLQVLTVKNLPSEPLAVKMPYKKVLTQVTWFVKLLKLPAVTEAASRTVQWRAVKILPNYKKHLTPLRKLLKISCRKVIL